MIPHAKWILLILGAICGAGLFGGVIAAVLIVLAQNAGAGWQRRHKEIVDAHT